MNQGKSTPKKNKGFTDEERAAMKERAKELKAEARANKKKAEGESDVLAKIAEMPEPDRDMATRLHALIKASAPGRIVGRDEAFPRDENAHHAITNSPPPPWMPPKQRGRPSKELLQLIERWC